MLFFSSIFFGADLQNESESYLQENITLVRSLLKQDCPFEILHYIKGEKVIDDTSLEAQTLRLYGQKWGFIGENQSDGDTMYSYGVKNKRCYFYHQGLSKKQHLCALLHAMWFNKYLKGNNDNHYSRYVSLHSETKKLRSYQFWENCAKIVAFTGSFFAAGAYYYEHKTAAAGFGLCAGFAGLYARYLRNLRCKKSSDWEAFCQKGDMKACKKTLERFDRYFTLNNNEEIGGFKKNDLSEIKKFLLRGSLKGEE